MPHIVSARLSQTAIASTESQVADYVDDAIKLGSLSKSFTLFCRFMNTVRLIQPALEKPESSKKQNVKFSLNIRVKHTTNASGTKKHQVRLTNTVKSLR